MGATASEYQTWDGTEIIALFPSSAALNRQVGGLLENKVVRIKAMTVVLHTSTGALRFAAGIGVGMAGLDYIGSSSIGIEGERIDLDIPDLKRGFNWDSATATAAFTNLASVNSLPPAGTLTQTEICIEVVD